jgi:hypothetical protein
MVGVTDEAGRDEDGLGEPELSCAKLYVVENGQGSPCLDLNRVSKEVGDATVGTDLVVFIGMGACKVPLVLHVLLSLSRLTLASRPIFYTPRPERPHKLSLQTQVRFFEVGDVEKPTSGSESVQRGRVRLRL